MRTGRSLTVAGAGMAGLAAAARARELGLDVVVLEKGERAGGSMVLSSCVIWRHRTLDDFRRECPGGDPALQRRVVDELDRALDWLEELGAEVVTRATGNPLTVGRRFDPRTLTGALVRAARDVRFQTSLPSDAEPPLVLATGGLGADLARRLGLPLRANRWSDGEGFRFARAMGAATAGDLDEFYGRAMPDAPFGETDFVRLSQLYGRLGVLLDVDGRELPLEPSWSEVELPQALARARGHGWLVVDGGALEQRVRERTVAHMVENAERAGAEVRRAGEIAALGFGPLESPRLRQPPYTAVRVVAAVTHALGGLRVDEGARVLREDGTPLAGVYAAGADVGAIASGGYASGLAAALVLGRAAAESAAAESR